MSTPSNTGQCLRLSFGRGAGAIALRDAGARYHCACRVLGRRNMRIQRASRVLASATFISFSRILGFLLLPVCQCLPIPPKCSVVVFFFWFSKKWSFGLCAVLPDKSRSLAVCSNDRLMSFAALGKPLGLEIARHPWRYSRIESKAERRTSMSRRGQACRPVN